MNIDTEPFKLSFGAGFFWFRLFGYGAHIINLKKHCHLYSERNKKRLIINGWKLKALYP